MPSGKKSKQMRRAASAPPPIQSKGGPRRRQANPKVLAIVGAVVVLAAVGIGLALALGGGSKASNNYPAIGTLKNALPGATDVNTLFKGIPQHGLVLGNSSSPAEMEMFIDVQCPICQNYEVSYLPAIVQKYIRTGKVQLHVQPWAFLGGQGSQSFSGRLGVIAASFQNKSLEYAKVLYDNQGQEESGWLTSREMAFIAASVTGLDLHKWWTDVNSSAATSIANDVDKLAKTAKITGTPTVLIGQTGGKLRDIMPPGYAPNLQITQAALDKALAKT